VTIVAIEGDLIVRLCCEARRVRQVTVRSTRPTIAARVLSGKAPADAAATVRRLFSICGGAQGAAAAAALAAAGATDAVLDSANRDREVMLEALQDTFWHLLIDWPNTMGTAPNATPVAAARFQIAAAMRAADGTPRLHDAAAMRELGERLSAIAAQSVFGMPPNAWVELEDVESLLAWCARGATAPATLLGRVLVEWPALGRSATPLMPEPQRGSLLGVIVPAMRDDPGFSRAPTWAGAAVETGGLARMWDEPLVIALQKRFGNAVVTRVTARLIELARLLQELVASDGATAASPRVRRMALGPGEGMAAVETARGMLLHRARLVDQRVADYQIVAPTEWNFHPGGALATGLVGLAAADDAQLLGAARLAAHALDPCVTFRVEVEHA
jgi:uptake hydrogenase large subunit